MSSKQSNKNLSLFKQFWQTYSLNNLASLWYSLLTTSLQIYIIIRAIYRFSAYISLPWPNGIAPQESINFYLLFIATSILILPFFIIVSLMKVGNYSNDGRKLGSFDIQKCLRYLNQNDDDEQLKKTSWVKIIWRHSLPVGPMLHLLMALCFLLPRLMTDAQLIRHGFLTRSDLWKTDLDFILKRLNGKIFNFFGMVQTINLTEHDYLFSDSATLGQYFIRNSKSLSETFYELDESGKFSPEFLNFILALFFLTARYPAVFWRVNKQFSLMLTFQLVINSLQSIIAFNAFQVAFKIFICDPTHLLIRFRESSSLSLAQLSMLMLIYLIILQFSSISLYIYGLHKYREFRYARTKYFQAKYEDSILWVNLLPYAFAMLFFLMLALTIGPLFYEFAIIYCGSLSISALLLLISTIVYFIFWILLWILLAVKTVWTFHYEDVESGDPLLIDGEKPSKHASILITNHGKIFKIKDDLATMAIINFIQSNGFEKSRLDLKTINQQNQNECNQQKSSKNKHNFNRTLNRFSTRTYNNKNQKKYQTTSFTLDRKMPKNHYFSSDIQQQQQSDSEGEYATFYRLKRTYSLNQKNGGYSKASQNRNQQEFELQNKRNLPSNKSNMSTNIAYGLMNPTELINIQQQQQQEPTQQDRISDISSGFHSNESSSHCSLLSPMDKTDSLESLMFKIEQAAQCQPKLLSTFQQPKPETFVTNTASKLIEFTENPDYSKYYLPQVIVSN